MIYNFFDNFFHPKHISMSFYNKMYTITLLMDVQHFYYMLITMM